MPSLAPAPRIHDLKPDDAHAFLARRHVGRIAFTLHDHVDIEPISYVCDGKWIFGRTSEGAKLSMLLHHPWCAFETDEYSDLFDWTSVVVKGVFHLLDAEIGSPDTYRRAEQLLRALIPGTFSEEDPAPHRDIVFGIFIHDIIGRGSQH